MIIPTSLRLGFFLAVRQLRRSNPWSTVLIVAVMVLTFLNLVVVSGILVGLIQGSINANQYGYVGDIAMAPIGEAKTIENSASLIALAESHPGVKTVTARYIIGGTAESNFKSTINVADRKIAAAQVVGVNPTTELAFTDYDKYMKEGEFLEEGDYDKVVLGANMLTRYLGFEVPGLKSLNDVGVGTKIRITINGAQRDVIVKGIIKRKVDEIDRAIIFTDKQFKDLTGISDVAIISMLLKPGYNANRVRDELITSGGGRYAHIRTYDEAMPKFIIDIRDTFAMLGNMISSIGLVVAAITVFIVIFINALTRRKFIGIMKGIGISGRTIEISYVFQSMFYALIGSSIGLLLLYGFLVPFFARNPINFPFSDGILVATYSGTALRVAILVFVTFVAGYVPAWMIVRRNTLNSILGR
ncbi:MAG: FtsX-like permease family protein [Minisyncoccia bacterium]